jgi:hypothetical protein
MQREGDFLFNTKLRHLYEQSAHAHGHGQQASATLASELLLQFNLSNAMRICHTSHASHSCSFTGFTITITSINTLLMFCIITIQIRKTFTDCMPTRTFAMHQVRRTELEAHNQANITKHMGMLLTRATAAEAKATAAEAKASDATRQLTALKVSCVHGLSCTYLQARSIY